MDLQIKKDALYRQLHHNILTGHYKDGYQFPPEKEFAEKLGVSRNTLRAALDRLDQEKLILRIKSKGTFVNHLVEHRKILALFNSTNDKSYPWHYIMPALAEEALKKDLEIMNCDLEDFCCLKREDVSKQFLKNNITGVVLINSNYTGNEPSLKLLKGGDVPVVLVHATLKDYQISGWATISAPVRESWRLTLEHLRSCGFDRILTVNNINPSKHIRGYGYEEYLDLLKKLGFDDNEHLILETSLSESQIFKERLRQIFKGSDFPHAVLCFSDFYAAPVYQILKELNLRIPEDVAVMGYCGAPIGKLMTPALSTVDLEYDKIGQLAIELMVKSQEWFEPINPEKVPPLVYSPFHLERRQSTNVMRYEGMLRTSDGGK